MRLHRMLKQIKPDIIHAHLDSFIRLLKYIGVPRVLTLHTTGMPLIPQVNQYDAVYCISDAVRRDVEKRYPGISTRVIPNGINFANMTQKASYGNKPFRLVQVSRLDHQQKGQDILLRAVKKVNDTLGDGQVTLDLIGEGPSKEFLLSLSEELGLENCRFLGLRSRSDVYENLHNYDLLVQPSRIEGFGLTVVEAMAAGLPVLVSDIEGPMEVIARGRYGYFFRSEDVDDCAKQILEIMRLSASPSFANDCKAAEQYAKRTYDVATTAKLYVKDYSRVVTLGIS
jgi:glycosyltransferase involved in cell wall biosynthesis